MKTTLKDCKWGRFLLLQGDMISRYVDLYGEWSELEVSLFQDILRNDDNVIEVGANIGMHTIPLSRIANQGKVICFEPQRMIYQLLSANCALNHRTNVFAEHMAVGNENSRIEIECTDYEQNWNYGAYSILKGYSSEQNFTGSVWTEQIDVVRLDDHPLVRDLGSLRLLKVDVEGLEIEVLDGAGETIDRYRPILFVENNNKKTGDALIQKIASLKYDSYWFCTERFTPQNFNKEARNIGGFDFNMVCIPEEKEIDAGPLDRVLEFDDLANGKARWIKRKIRPAV